MKSPVLEANWLTLLLVPLAACTITVLFAVAALPALLLAPDPTPAAESVGAPGETLALALTGQGTWILNGMPLAPADGGPGPEGSAAQRCRPALPALWSPERCPGGGLPGLVEAALNLAGSV